MKRLLLQSLGRAGCVLALAATLAGLSWAQSSTPWPEVPLPPHARVEWVADSMKVNGIPMRVMRFESTASRTEIVAYYTAHWSGAYRTKPAIVPLGDTTLVGQAHGPYYMTVKVGDAPRDGSAGFISVSRILGHRTDRSAGALPLMPGARVLSVVESSDSNRRCRELVIAQDASADSVRHYYEGALESGGWRAVQMTATDPPRPQPAGSFEIYRRDESELSISVMAGSDGSGSTVVATLVTKGDRLSAE